MYRVAAAPGRSTPAPTEPSGRVAVLLLGAFVFRVAWLIPILAVLVGVGAALGPERNPLQRLVHEPSSARACGRRPRPFAAETVRSQDVLAFGLLGVATLCLLIGLGGFAWILAVVEGLIAAVAATTGLHLGVRIRDQLDGANSRCDPRPSTPVSAHAPAEDLRLAQARLIASCAAPNARHHTIVGPASAPLGEPIASTARAASTPLRTTRRGPTGASTLAPPKHGQGNLPRLRARTSTTVNTAAVSRAATTPGTGHHATSATATASSSAGRPRRTNAPQPVTSDRATICARRRAGARSFATAEHDHARRASDQTRRATRPRRPTRQLSYRPYPPR